MKRALSDDLNSSNKRIHSASLFENTDLVAIILKNIVTEDGRDLVKLGLISKVFFKCITSPRYDEFIWKSHCHAADPFVSKNGKEERFWFVEWKKRALRKYNFVRFVSHHEELQKSPQYQTWLNDPKKYFCFLLRATPTVREEKRYEDFSNDAIKTLDDQFAVGQSKLGGFPDLPKGVEWPIGTLRRYSEGPLDFKAQINMEQVRFYDRHNMLPKDGIMYFFHKRDGASNTVRYYSKAQIASLGGLERKIFHPETSDDEEGRPYDVDSFPPWKLEFGEGVVVDGWEKATIKSSYEQRNFRLDEIAQELDQAMEEKPLDDPELEEEEEEEIQETRYIQHLGPNSLTVDAEVEIEVDSEEEKPARGKSGRGLGASSNPRLEKECLLDLRDHTAGCIRDSVWLWIILKRDLEKLNFSRVAAWQCED